MCIELREQGFNVGRYRVRQIMKSLSLVAKRPGRHRYPRGGKPAVVAANLLNRQFNPETLTIWFKKNSELDLLGQTGQCPDYPGTTTGGQ
jgi:putative transposase